MEVAAAREAVAALIASRAGWLMRQTYSVPAAGYVMTEDRWSETSTEIRNRAFKLADEILELTAGSPAQSAAISND